MAQPLNAAIHTLAQTQSRVQPEVEQEKTDEESVGKADEQPHASAIKQDGGVTRIEALYLVFGKGWGLYSLWISIGLIAYVYSLSRSTTAYYAQFATSSFGTHTIIGTIGVINGILNGVAPPFIAKLADAWSRPHALALAIAFYVLGYAVCAGASGIKVFVAGQVFCTIGNAGITFLISLLVADITSLEWRAFVNGCINIPYVVNAFVAGSIVEGINGYSANGWRWGYGMFCILVPVAMSPALAILFIGDHRAKKLGTLAVGQQTQEEKDQAEQTRVRRTLWQSVRYYWTRLNIFGLLLMGFGFAMLLTPMTLSTTAKGGYNNPSLIAMLVIGGVLFISWCIWDGFFAEHPFMPRRVFNRTFCACVAVDFFYFSSSYLVDAYFPSWVYVIVDWNDRNYTYFNNTVTVAMCGLAVFFGLLMRYTHRYKWLQVGGLSIRVIGMGLTYHATKNPSDLVLVWGRILVGVGGAISVIASYIGVQGSVPHQDMAIATAVLNLWSSIGSSITIAISASVWNAELPANLDKYLGTTYNATELNAIFIDIYAARLTEPRPLVKQAYLDSMSAIYIGAVVVSICSVLAGLFAVNFQLTKAHNAIEPHKIIKFRDQKEIDEELARRA